MAQQELPKNSVVITDHITDFTIARAVLGEALALELHPDIEVAIVWRHKVDHDFLNTHPKVRGVVRYGAGFDNIDVEAATAHGIIACNNPTYGVAEVSDTALSMIMALSRCIFRYDAIAREVPSSWQANVIPGVKRTSETLLGIIGAGRIGSSTLLKAKAVGYQTIFFDPYAAAGIEKVYGCRRASTLDELLSDADIVSFHVPLSAETRGMISPELISRMKSGAILVNTARGGIVADLGALMSALADGKLQGVGLDVLPEEPPRDLSALQGWLSGSPEFQGRYIINPHTAYYSVQSQQEMHRLAAETARSLLGNEVPNTILNPEVLPDWRKRFAQRVDA